MGLKFHGSLQELKSLLLSMGCLGDWSGGDPAHFKDWSGAVLRWHPTTGTVVMQGPEKLRDALRSKLEVAIEHWTADKLEEAKATVSRSNQQLLPRLEMAENTERAKND